MKIVRKLHTKKGRQEAGQFIVEGEKLIVELLSSNFKVDHVYGNLENPPFKFDTVPNKDLERLTAFKTHSGCLAIVNIPEFEVQQVPSIILDDIRDPGNLGTIIRTAEWFGIKQIVCSETSVDCFNPKVVQASMGSIFRMSVIYTNVEEFVLKSEIKTVAAVMNGMNKLPEEEKIHLLMGSESHGVSENLEAACEYTYTIEKKGKAESLNVAMACGIILGRL